MECLSNGTRSLLPDIQAFVRSELLYLPFDLVELTDVLKRIPCNLALAGRMQIVELAPRVRHATELGHALCKQCFIAGEVIADELPSPVSQEVPRVFTRPTVSEVVDDRLQILEGPGAIGP